jgi:hypothetical protein
MFVFATIALIALAIAGHNPGLALACNLSALCKVV